MCSVAEGIEFRPRPPRGRLAPSVLLCGALAGCGLAHLPGSAPPAALPKTDGAAATAPAPRATPASTADEAALVTFYSNVEKELIATGRMRLDTAPADAPYGVDDLVRDFQDVALNQEYVMVGNHLEDTATPIPLRRWTGPVRVGVVTSASTPPADAAHDRGNVAAFTQRLARLTGTDMTMGQGNDVNFAVLFMTNAEREAFATEVATRFPTFSPAMVAALRSTPLDTFCTTYSFFQPDDVSAYSAVIIVIRAEHPPLTRLSCVNEEMSQAMGLPNDSRDSRPSLYNPSIEFALLTEHDETLLRMLYDPRLHPGMSAEQIRPLLPEIARDAMAAEQAQKGRTEVATN